ncbi:hypothetical protein ACFX15_018994 [Malus domestica]
MTLGRENEAAQHWVAGCCFRQISVDSSGRLGSDRLQKRTAQYGMQAVCLLHSHGPREKKKFTSSRLAATTRAREQKSTSGCYMEEQPLGRVRDAAAGCKDKIKQGPARFGF